MPRQHKRFLSTVFMDGGGAILPLYAMIFGTLLIAVGSAADFARAFSAKSTMQSALDAASTSALAHYRKTGNADDAERHLRELVTLNLANSGLTLAGNEGAGGSSSKKGNVVLSDGQIQVSAQSISPSLSTNYQTLIMGIIGITDIDIYVSATATFSNTTVEVALALAVTEELCDGNAAQCQTGEGLDGLKTATKSLLDAAAPSPTTRYAIVPFSSAVNVGNYVAAATNAPETIQGDDETGNKSEGKISCRGKICATLYLTNCVSERDGGAGRTNDPPKEHFFSDPVWSTSPAAGCIPADANAVLPLTEDKSEVSKFVNGMTAQGQSAGHIGISWAWYTISEKWASFWGKENAPATSETTKKSVIFVADGDFTVHDDANSCRGTKYCNHSHVDAEHICDAMRDEGITVYAVAYKNGGSTFSTKGLENFLQCASPGKQHTADTPKSLESIFQIIAQELVLGNGQIILTN